jgi:hypothetical protein
MSKLTLGLIAAALLGGVSVVVGQVVYDSASTAAEGYARGVGDIISSAGQYNVATSQANINNQTATSMAIDNQMKWTNTYFEMRKVNRDARSAERGPTATTEDWVRWSKMAQPKRLNSVALDPISGKITWPPVLTLAAFAPYRTQFEAFYANRATHGVTAGYQNILSLESTTNAMTDELKKHIREVPTQDYLTARNFIESLGYEARFASN